MLKETLVIMGLGSAFANLASWKLIVGHDDIYYAKKNKLFRICWDKNSFRKGNYIWRSHFPEDIGTKMLIVNDLFLCLYTRFSKKNFKFSFFKLNLR